MKTITSRQNALYKRVRRAIDEHAGEIVIEGPKAVADATAAGWKPIAVIESDDVAPALSRRSLEDPQSSSEFLGVPRPPTEEPGNRRNRGTRLDGTPAESRLHVTIADAKLFDSLAETKTSQGVIGLFERPASTDIFADRDRVVVALDAVQDPGNVGTIVRLAAAFDAGGVVLLPGCADAYSPKAIRASVGAILNVPIVNMLTNDLIARGWPLFAADAAGMPIDPPGRGAVLLFGNEGSGVSADLRAHSTPIAIPMSSRVESLNVAASAAILLARSYALR
jgi:TrmH family RNA methyltransferase